MSNKCLKCNENFEIDEDARTPLELACEHEICIKCYCENAEIIDGKIKCLICGEENKLKKQEIRLLIGTNERLN